MSVGKHSTFLHVGYLVAATFTLAIVRIVVNNREAATSYFPPGRDTESTDLRYEWRRGDYPTTESTPLDGWTNQQETRQRRLPQAVIIGEMKCGTRALINSLALHPDVVTAEHEVGYFVGRNYDRGLEWYRSQMPTSRQNQITIEKTPNYFIKSAVAAPRIHAMNASTKIILIVRDPVARAVSDWLQFCRKFNQTHIETCRTFERSGILAANGHINPKCAQIRRSSYALEVDKWTTLFPLHKQFHVVSGEKLVLDPVSELKKVESFLGLRQHITERNIAFEGKRRFFCMVSDDGEKRCLKPSSKGVKHPDLIPHVEATLRAYFKQLNQRFYRQVGQDFGWD